MVAASSDDGGTNAILLTPPDVIPPCFEPDSFMKHLLARAKEYQISHEDNQITALLQF